MKKPSLHLLRQVRGRPVFSLMRYAPRYLPRTIGPNSPKTNRFIRAHSPRRLKLSCFMLCSLLLSAGLGLILFSSALILFYPFSLCFSLTNL